MLFPSFHHVNLCISLNLKFNVDSPKIHLLENIVLLVKKFHHYVHLSSDFLIWLWKLSSIVFFDVWYVIGCETQPWRDAETTGRPFFFPSSFSFVFAANKKNRRFALIWTLIRPLEPLLSCGLDPSCLGSKPDHVLLLLFYHLPFTR